MSLPKIAKHDEWLAARTELLAAEKDLTRSRDALNRRRRELPMVEVGKDYVFEGPGGAVRPGRRWPSSSGGSRSGAGICPGKDG